MKKRLLAAVLAATTVLLSACGSGNASSTASGNGGADHLAKIQKAGKLVVGLEGDWQPFSYHDKDDKLVGYDVEVAQNIAKKLGVEADIQEGPWDGLFAGMDSGRYDIVVNGVDVTEERQKKYDFSDPYAYDHTVLIVKKGNKDIKTFDDLKGKTTANSIGSTYQEIGEQYGATVKGVDTLVETLQMVKNGQVDATINASTSFGDYMKSNPDDPLEVAATTPEATKYAIPLEKGKQNDSLRKAINKAIKEMRDDGTLKELSVKYFGSDLTNE
jgi:cystine transport system substrate-binding protein